MPLIARLRSIPAPQRRAGAIAAAVIVCDATSKAIVAHALAGRGIVNVVGGAFHLELYRNHAGPGNVLTGHPVLVTVLSLAAVLALGVACWMVRTKAFAVGLGLLLGGGVGNLVDRFVNAPGPFHGGVIDWIKPTLHSGSMNIADLAINAGVIAVLLAVALECWGNRQRTPVPSTSRS